MGVTRKLMQTSLSQSGFADYVSAQCNNMFPDGNEIDSAHLRAAVDVALQRVEHCFSRVAIPRYVIGGEAQFSHLDSDQYLIFLWFLSNELWKRHGNSRDATKVFLLNKALHAFNCMYDCPLPDIFLVIHGLSIVLGKATYDDYLYVFQGCTVGAHANKYPVLGRGVALGAGAKIIGDCNVGSYASVGAGTVLVNQCVEQGHAIFRRPDGALTSGVSKPLAEQGYFKEYLYG